MAAANLVTESLGKRYSDSVMEWTIADAIADSKYQFTKCYRRRTIQTMEKKPKLEPTPSVEILKKMVADCGGPAKFARAYSRDDADEAIDPTFVSQIINGHRAFNPNRPSLLLGFFSFLQIALAIVVSICYRYTNNPEPTMTHHETQLKAAYQRSGLSFLGMSYSQAMSITAIRIALECAVKASSKGKPAPIQPGLI